MIRDCIRTKMKCLFLQCLSKKYVCKQTLTDKNYCSVDTVPVAIWVTSYLSCSVS